MSPRFCSPHPTLNVNPSLFSFVTSSASYRSCNHPHYSSTISAMPSRTFHSGSKRNRVLAEDVHLLDFAVFVVGEFFQSFCFDVQSCDLVLLQKASDGVDSDETVCSCHNYPQLWFTSTRRYPSEHLIRI